MAAAGGLLALLSAASVAQAAFPGANGKIAYVNSTMSGDAIFSVNPDGSGLAQLTSNAPGDADPVWSADGSRVVFTRRTGGGGIPTQVWVMNADGSGEAQLTTGNFDCDPAFLPDGRVVFVRAPSFCPENGDLYVRAVDGTETQLTTAPMGDEDTNPTSSPNGATIAFARGDFGDTVIYSVGSAGGAVTPLTDDHGSASILDQSPNYAPGGATIAFDRCETIEGCDGRKEIATVPAAGGAVTPLTSGTHPDYCGPAYAPDGSLLVFASLTSANMGSSTNCELFNASPAVLAFMSSAGGAVQSSAVTGFRPDWQPLAAASAPPSGDSDSGGVLGARGSLNGRCFHEDVTIRGTHADEKIVGTPGNDVIRGFRGNDKINGVGGEDILCGGRGEDRIFGKKGNDILIGGDHSDFLKGGPGINRLFGGTPGAPIEKAQNVCVLGSGDTEQNCQVLK